MIKQKNVRKKGEKDIKKRDKRESPGSAVFRMEGCFIFFLLVPAAQRTLRLQQELPRQDLLPESLARASRASEVAERTFYYLPVLEETALLFPAEFPCSGNLQRSTCQTDLQENSSFSGTNQGSADQYFGRHIRTAFFVLKLIFMTCGRTIFILYIEHGGRFSFPKGGGS
jgi:hypothetical protein